MENLAPEHQRQVASDPRLQEKVAAIENPPIEDKQAAEQVFRDLDTKYTKEEAALRKVIDAGASGETLRKAIQTLKANRFQASDTLFSPENRAAIDRLKVMGDPAAAPLRAQLAQRYLDIEPPDKPDGTPDLNRQRALREAVLQEADAAGVPREYITGHGPDSYRGERFKDPKVREAVAQYEADQETLRPYREVQDKVLQQYPNLKKSVDRVTEMEQRFGAGSPQVKLYEQSDDALKFLRDRILAEKARLLLKGQMALYKVGVRQGYWGAMTPQRYQQLLVQAAR
jgi:hypothetical protein